ncbi:MAG: hypothetical protein LBG59_03645 [Candidatus Peribacteria bacterium]|jgi:glycosyltransferase involved in cell wall biosynthesis|nr:hypothetical protein [Candidatus Peribacteria bacterium]
MLGLLYYGRLEKEKGFDALLEVIKTLQTKEDDQSPEFFIFGAGSLERELLPLTK